MLPQYGARNYSMKLHKTHHRQTTEALPTPVEEPDELFYEEGNGKTMDVRHELDPARLSYGKKKISFPRDVFRCWAGSHRRSSAGKYEAKESQSRNHLPAIRRVGPSADAPLNTRAAQLPNPSQGQILPSPEYSKKVSDKQRRGCASVLNAEFLSSETARFDRTSSQYQSPTTNQQTDKFIQGKKAILESIQKKEEKSILLESSNGKKNPDRYSFKKILEPTKSSQVSNLDLLFSKISNNGAPIIFNINQNIYYNDLQYKKEDIPSLKSQLANRKTFSSQKKTNSHRISLAKLPVFSPEPLPPQCEEEKMKNTAYFKTKKAFCPHCRNSSVGNDLPQTEQRDQADPQRDESTESTPSVIDHGITTRSKFSQNMIYHKFTIPKKTQQKEEIEEQINITFGNH